MTQQRYNITTDQLDELKECIEDMITYFCDENMISGETAWIVTECLATSKIAQLNGHIK